MNTLQFIRFQDIRQFMQLVEPVLMQAEAINNLMLGICKRLEVDPAFYGSPPFLAATVDADGLTLAAVMTPPHNLILYSPCEHVDAELELLGEHLYQQHISLPGVLGPVALASAFALHWSERTGLPARLGVAERVFELRRVIPPPPASGFMRPAVDTDAELLVTWSVAFQKEALPNEVNPDHARRTVLLGIQDQRLYVWEDGGRPVSEAMATRPTPHGISIGLVYTPPELRRRGYATALVAELSQRMLDSGREFCTLFTDLANPISNSIYQKIGYQPIGDYSMIFFGAE